MFYFVGDAVSKGENSKDISDDGDESSGSVDSNEEADGSGGEQDKLETKNTRGWSKLTLQ